MKTADMAAACLGRAQPMKSKSGVRKMPPPVPVKPESKPIKAPVASAASSGGALAGLSVLACTNKRTAETKSAAPSSNLKPAVGKLMAPPMKAQGTAKAAKGHRRAQEKCPARQNCHAAMAETKMFSAKALGRITLGAKLSKDITAM